MKRFLTALVATVLATGISSAETDSKAREEIEAIRKGRDTKDQIVTLRVKEDATIGGDLAVTGTFAAAVTNMSSAVIQGATANLLVTNSANNGTADIYMKADRADDAGDYWDIRTSAAGSWLLRNDHASQGTLADILAIDKDGIVTLDGGAILDNSTSASELNITETGVKITGNATITGTHTQTGVTTLNSNLVMNSAVASILMSNTLENATVDIGMMSDQADDAGDYWNMDLSAAGTFAFQNDHASAGTLATVLAINKDGRVTLDGGAILDNETSAAELNITETTVKITGAFATTADATIAGGDITGANGNAIDIGEAADGSITLSRDDAGTVTIACVDNDANADMSIQPGGTGDLTLGDVGSDTTVAGALNVTGIASFTAIPSFNAAAQAPGTLGIAITNCPAGVSATNAPIWFKATYGTTNGVIPFFVIP